MDAHPPFGSPVFKLVTKGLIALHRLIKEGKDESPEAESVRDALDVPLGALNPMEYERSRWLSEDLFSISEPGDVSTLKQMNLKAQQQLNDAVEASQSREWDQALDLLRRSKEYISPALLSYMRGSIWSKAGHPDVAAVFFGHASESDPENANYRAFHLHALAESDPGAAARRAREVLADDGQYAPIVVAQAASIRFNEIQTTSDTKVVQVFYRELIPYLERNVTRIENDEAAASLVKAHVMTVGLLGMMNEFLGNGGAAVGFYTRGLQLNPNNDALLVARGILLYGTSPRAIADFELAIGLGSSLIWPYLFLAHHYLTTSRFEQGRLMCETGLKKCGSDSAKSQLEEGRAIAQIELGFPPEMVRSAFEAALRLDPTNEGARRNQEAYEASLLATHTSPGSRWEQKSSAAVRLFGLAERRSTLVASELSFAA